MNALSSTPLWTKVSTLPKCVNPYIKGHLKIIEWCLSEMRKNVFYIFNLVIHSNVIIRTEMVSARGQVQEQKPLYFKRRVYRESGTYKAEGRTNKLWTGSLGTTPRIMLLNEVSFQERSSCVKLRRVSHQEMATELLLLWSRDQYVAGTAYDTCKAGIGHQSVAVAKISSWRYRKMLSNTLLPLKSKTSARNIFT